jgi:hypothetical protein
MINNLTEFLAENLTDSMIKNLNVLGIVLLANFLVVLVYWILNIPFNPKQDRKAYVICGVIMLLCPVVGPCFFALAQVFYRAFFYEPVDLDGIIFSKERVRTFIRADEESERNMVPLEEAIEVASTDELRNLMMNIVRGDIQKSLAAIALALNSEDTETAHYAASVLQDALNDFRATVQKELHKLRSATEGNVGVSAGMLIDYMNQVLRQRVLTDIEQKDYIKIMDEVCEILYEYEKERMTSAQFEAIALRALEMEEFDICQKWCERAVYQYPNTLSTYTCQLKLFFNSGQKERFFEVLDELKKSSIVIDSETLELIRVFQ